jgi:cyanophycinase
MTVPPTPRRRADDRAGPLVLIGGAADPMGEALASFVDLARARDGGRIVGFTSASGDPAAAAHAWRNDFALAGARQVEIPIVAKRQRAHDPQLVARVRDAQGIFLGGGDQVQLVAVLGGTPVGEAIREAHARGAVVCGTSAGAAAITETILAYGESDATDGARQTYMGPGFGLLGFHAMIDTHFAARRRLHRLFLAIARNPLLLGLGIDEDTGLVVRGHVGRVVGRGGVTFVDGRSVRYDNAAELPADSAALTLSHLRVGIVGAGHELDLRARELVALLDDAATPAAAGAPDVRDAPLDAARAG